MSDLRGKVALREGKFCRSEKKSLICSHLFVLHGAMRGSGFRTKADSSRMRLEVGREGGGSYKGDHKVPVLKGEGNGVRCLKTGKRCKAST